MFPIYPMSGIRYDKRGRYLVTDEHNDEVYMFNKRGRHIASLSDNNFSVSDQTATTTTFFKQPRYICMTPDGSYVISDSANHCIKMFDSNGDFSRQFGGYGRLDGELRFPYGVACDSLGHVYVADHYNNRVSLFTAGGTFVQHVLTSDEGVTRPKGLAVVKDLLYVSYGERRSSNVSVYRMMKTNQRRISKAAL